MSQHQRKYAAHTDAEEHSDNVTPFNPKRNKSPVEAILKLRRLISELTREVESLNENSLPLLETGISENCESINFYDEIARFEMALIKSALRRTNGHQILAARLLNLNPSTLNAKIKLYRLQPRV